ncbi:MAG TPA: RMD1 family protein [Polyangiaceae bacterium]|nr:RMD1 family protein [Polyangiaceae bacterium]
MDSAPKTHSFTAIAFAENFPLRDLALSYPDARRSPREIRYPLRDGSCYLYPFGAIVFRNVPEDVANAEVDRLRKLQPRLTAPAVKEQFTVMEEPGAPAGVSEGVLRVDRLGPDRAGIVALTVAQSAAMEYYERIVTQMFERTAALVERLERVGTVSVRTRPLHRFIGEAIATRSEVFTVLALLDKPDETWEDRTMDRIYADLRAEFDLGDRYVALELKLRSVQESLELVLGVARERRLVLLEVAILLLFVLELVLPALRLR